MLKIAEWLSGIDWADLVSKIGIPGGLLFLLVYYLQKFCAWIGENVVKPMVGQHVEFLKAGVSTMAKIATSQDQTSVVNSKMLFLLEELHRKVMGGPSEVDFKYPDPPGADGAATGS